MEVGKIYEMPERVATVSSIASVGVSVANMQSEDKYVTTAPSSTDTIEISVDAKAKYQTAKKAADDMTVEEQAQVNITTEQDKQNSVDNKKAESNKTSNYVANTTELSNEQKQSINDLKARDAEVRAHEQAHLSASGGLASGGASFSFQTGPDGQSYAIGGEVQIDISAESDPKQTITKMQQVRRAALAPADPSSQDRAIANQASQIAAQAISAQNSGMLASTTASVNNAKASDSMNSEGSQSDSIGISLNRAQANSNSADSQIVNAMGGTGSLTVLKYDASDRTAIRSSLLKIYSQSSNQASSTLKTFA